MSKLLLYEFYYNKIDKRWPNTEIIRFDTDSMILNIYSDDVYENVKKIQNDLDTSEYSCCWPEGNARYHLYTNKNKQVVGKFKDELYSEIIKEIIFMKSKVYAYKIKNGSKNSLQDKGIKRMF